MEHMILTWEPTKESNLFAFGVCMCSNYKAKLMASLNPQLYHVYPHLLKQPSIIEEWFYFKCEDCAFVYIYGHGALYGVTLKEIQYMFKQKEVLLKGI